jgi:hypothetical protein
MADRKLLDQVRDKIRLMHYSYKTELAYVEWAARMWNYRMRWPRNIPTPGGSGAGSTFFRRLVFHAIRVLAWCGVITCMRHRCKRRFPNPLGMLELSNHADRTHFATRLQRDCLKMVTIFAKSRSCARA